MRSHDDVELTVHSYDASSDSSDETIELSPQVTVKGSVAGHTKPPAMATSSYYDLSLAASGRPMSVTSRWVEQQRERSPPIRSAFSATGLPTVAYDRSVSQNSLRCDEEVARLSASAASPPRPRTSSAPDNPSRCNVNVPVGNSNVARPHRPLVLGLTPRLICRRVHSPVHRHRCQVSTWQAYSTVWSTVSTTTCSKPELTLHSVSNQPELKSKQKLPIVNNS